MVDLRSKASWLLLLALQAVPQVAAAQVADVFAFRSYAPSAPNHVTLIMTVHPLREPGAGPGENVFDPNALYEIKVDNNNDALADISFQFRFAIQERFPLLGLYTGMIGVGSGALAPANSPPPIAPGTVVVPPRIDDLTDVGLSVRQSYSVNIRKNGVTTAVAGGPFYAAPPNVGPRTADYGALFDAAIYSPGNGIRIFAGTTDDPSWSDFGGLMDTLNLHGAGAVMSTAENVALVNRSSDTHSGFPVLAIAIEAPISFLTRTGAIESANSVAATIGVSATLSLPQVTELQASQPPLTSGPFVQVSRVGNPLIRELIIGTAAKGRFNRDQPKNDSQFVGLYRDPRLARVFNALTAGAIAIPAPPRLDLLPLLQYVPPISAPGTPAGPIADLLRLNTGVGPTVAFQDRTGLLGGDPAGFPNGRRPGDDVVDILLRLVVGGVLAAPFPGFTSGIGDRLGDFVNVNDASDRTTFPYLADAPSGRDRRHIDPGEPGCTAGVGAPCLP